MNKLTDTINHAPVAVKQIADAGAFGLAWGAFFTDVVPAIAATLSVIWLSLQIYSWVVNKKWVKRGSNS